MNPWEPQQTTYHSNWVNWIRNIYHNSKLELWCTRLKQLTFTNENFEESIVDKKILKKLKNGDLPQGSGYDASGYGYLKFTFASWEQSLMDFDRYTVYGT